MRGDDKRAEGMFSYVRLEERIAADHPLRAIRRLVDEVLTKMSGQLSGLYSHTGRPSIAPEQLLKATLLQAFFTVRSERQLVEQIDYNMLFRWFVGLAMDDQVWDASTFSKNRDRHIDSQTDVAPDAGEQGPVPERAPDNEVRQRLVERIARRGKECRRRHYPVFRMAEPDQCFGAADRHRPEVELWLVPHFEPIVFQCRQEIDVARRGARVSHHAGDPCNEFRNPERLAQERQHAETVTRADGLHLLEEGCFVAADQQNLPAEPRSRKTSQHFDRIGSSERQIENDDIGPQPRERHFDLHDPAELADRKSGSAQRLRNEGADLRVIVDNECMTRCRLGS